MAGQWIFAAAAVVAVLTASPAVLAVALGVIVTQQRPSCPAVWTVPTLLLSVLFLGHAPVLLALFAILFWPAVIEPDGETCPGMAAVLGAALVWHAPEAAAPGLVGGLGLGILALIGRAVLLARRPGDLSLLRPALLMMLVVAAGNENLVVAARVALEAVMLDLALLTLSTPLSRWLPLFPLLRLPFPPLPGLLVLWLGLHAALGIAAGLEGWSVLGVGVALLLGILGLSDLLVVGRSVTVEQRPVTGLSILALGLGCLLAPVLVFGVFSPVLHAVGGEWIWPIWTIGGGDGAHLRLFALMSVGVFVWGLLVRPWRVVGGIVQISSALLPAVHGVLRLGDALFDAPPAFGWNMRRIIVDGRRRLRAVRAMKRPCLPDMQHGAVGLWLVLLGMVLAALGLMS